jgi:hypothetical protein
LVPARESTTSSHTLKRPSDRIADPALAPLPTRAARFETVNLNTKEHSPVNLHLIFHDFFLEKKLTK